MGDSDDTDILLSISPDHYLKIAEAKLRQEQLAELMKPRPPHPEGDAPFNVTTAERFFERNQEVAMAAADALAMPPPTAAYQFLTPNRKAELNHINARLHAIEREANDGHVLAPSDISTISNSTVRPPFERKEHQPRNSGLFVHSTPKCGGASELESGVHEYLDDGVLLEIDNFLDERPQWQQPLDGAEEASQQQPLVPYQQRTAKTDDNLISLSEIWGKGGQSTAIPALTPSTLKEEQLRRHHLEKTVRSLQSRLLEYQQRLSVAIEVDRAKDAALANSHAELQSFSAEVKQLRASLQKLETEQRDYNSRTDSLQKELSQAVSLATKFQEKNEQLERELAAHAKTTNECNGMYKQQVEELELKMHACKRSEDYANNELAKLKDRLAKAEYHADKLKMRCEDAEKECSNLRHQKELLQDFHQKQKNRADSLEVQKKSLQDSIDKLNESEEALKKKLDIQQKSLKAHYQQQLENVVAQKLKEYQEQLDKTEDKLKAASHDRERLIAERAVRQLEMINEKNELELNLLQEKHDEEVALYRIQLANASKKIEDLEAKLDCFKSKRADIAEKLHSVMETQWQKALEILTSPNQSHQIKASETTDDESPDTNETHIKDNVTGHHQTPKSIKTRKDAASGKENNFNFVNPHTRASSPIDRLQAYIELLLSKSPEDFEKLDEILALSTKSKLKLDKNSKRFRNIKPPWKA